MKLGNLVYLDFGKKDSIAVILSDSQDSDHVVVFDLIDNTSKLMQKQSCFNCGELILKKDILEFKKLIENINDFKYQVALMSVVTSDLMEMYKHCTTKWEGYESIFNLSDLRF